MNSSPEYRTFDNMAGERYILCTSETLTVGRDRLTLEQNGALVIHTTGVESLSICNVQGHSYQTGLQLENGSSKREMGWNLGQEDTNDRCALPDSLQLRTNLDSFGTFIFKKASNSKTTEENRLKSGTSNTFMDCI